MLPSLVTELKYAVLVPSGDSPVSSSTVQSFAIAGGEAITENAGGAVVLRGAPIAHGTIVGAGTDFKTVLLKNALTGAYTLYDIPNATPNPIAISRITSIALDPSDATIAVVGMS